ncbi:MAG: hypothetical protein QM817_41525 [Archangium sp.]
MKRALLCVVVCVATLAVADDSFKKAEAAYAAAALQSKAEKYDEAAKLLVDAAAEITRANREERYTPDALRKAAETYTLRAKLKATALSDAKSARAMLKSLVSEPGLGSEHVERIGTDDPRVAALLKTLREKDPKAKAFFTARKIKVVVSGDALNPAQAASLTDRLVNSLRGLGFDASKDAGDETIEVPVKQTPMLPVPMFGGGNDPNKLGAGEFKCIVTWSDAKNTVLIFDLGMRGPGYTDMPTSFVDQNWQRLGTAFVPRLLLRWDEASPTGG